MFDFNIIQIQHQAKIQSSINFEMPSPIINIKNIHKLKCQQLIIEQRCINKEMCNDHKTFCLT